MLFGGFTSFLVLFGIKNVGGGTVTIFRACIIFVLSIIYMMVSDFHKDVKNLTETDIRYLILSAFTTFLSSLFLYKAIKESNGLFSVTLIEKCSVLITLLLAGLFLKEYKHLPKETYFGACLIIAGFFLVTVSLQAKNQ
jgi:uncharacterized membrane protein